MTIVSKANEQELLKAEVLLRAREGQSTVPLVERCLREDPHLYANNKAKLITTRNQKEADDEQIDWDDLVKQDDEN